MAGKGYIDIDDADYPILLRLISDPPTRLYYSGNLELLKSPTVAIVGSRKSTEYGSWAARTIAKRLSDYGISVVSGMAEGIDSRAHEGAISGQTPTIAVFGSSLDICFPRFNKGLMKQIEETGLILSEYPETTHPTRYTFPQRNRIISGLSYATVVVEAGIKSGSLITAEFAVDQGREVYAVPANINRKSSVGCNKLIRDGAKPLAFIDDILYDLGIETNFTDSMDAELSGEQKRIMEALEKRGELSIDSLQTLLALPIGVITGAVTILEIKGLVSVALGNVMRL
ncbi:MAG: DNA-processing protein DprA [Clostridiales Family XIII bacterium]|jgi:DNA processing protein|nr:DNA-processing protein DprA [Clostridiales Family XIII bacterium]